MDAILKFKEAAKAFQEDSRYQTLAAARKANDDDKELQAMLGEFNLVRLDINNEMDKKEGRDEAHVAELNKRLNTLYGGIMGNANMLAYNAAKEGIEEVITHVNAILNAAIDGEDPMLVEAPAPSGCGKEGCAACPGCS